jgi:hypothetical protein
MFRDLNYTSKSSDAGKNEPFATPDSRPEASFRGQNRIASYFAEEIPEAQAAAETPVPPALKWYVALLVFESKGVEEWTDPTVDVQYCLVRATDRDAAYSRALVLGKEGEGTSETSEGKAISWTFKGLQDLDDVLEDELTDGVEIYGFIEEGVGEDYVVPKEDLSIFLDLSIADEAADSTDTEDAL